MSAQPAPGRLAAWRAFLEAHARVVRRLESEIEEHCGIPLVWYDVLVQLSEADGHALRMFDLAERVLLSRSGLTRLVDRMEDTGLVARAEATGDRRGTLVTLTDKGNQTLQDAAPVHLAGIEEHFGAHLSPEEARTLHRVFRRILGADRPPED